ncbi:MAG: peptidylprolyl isomerase [Clostridia bacterium]|nr:peptidylprolyl isomerase [Clostridia bacterium]
MKKKEWIYILGVAILCVAGMAAALLFGGGKKAAPVEDYIAKITIRDQGTITLRLDGSAAPLTVKNFAELAESGFYEGLTFHRIMEGFMMQGGAPAEESRAAKPIKGEFAANGIENPLSHTRGAISMARTNDPNSASSQFFICHEDSIFLDGNYAAFGYVTEGMEIVDAICEGANPIDDNGTILKGAQPIIETIKVEKA